MLPLLSIIPFCYGLPNRSYFAKHSKDHGTPRIKECRYPDVLSTDACCARAFANAAYDASFITWDLIALLNLEFELWIPARQRRRPVQSIGTICETPNQVDPWMTRPGRRLANVEHTCFFECQDTRNDMEFERVLLGYLKDQETASRIIRMIPRAPQLREMPGFVLYCDKHARAVVNEKVDLWLGSESKDRRRSTARCVPLDSEIDAAKPTTSEPHSHQEEAAVEGLLDSDPDILVPANLIWTEQDSERLGYDLWD